MRALLAALVLSFLTGCISKGDQEVVAENEAVGDTYCEKYCYHLENHGCESKNCLTHCEDEWMLGGDCMIYAVDYLQCMIGHAISCDDDGNPLGAGCDDEKEYLDLCKDESRCVPDEDPAAPDDCALCCLSVHTKEARAYYEQFNACVCDTCAEGCTEYCAADRERELNAAEFSFFDHYEACDGEPCPACDTCQERSGCPSKCTGCDDFTQCLEQRCGR